MYFNNSLPTTTSVYHNINQHLEDVEGAEYLLDEEVEEAVQRHLDVVLAVQVAPQAPFLRRQTYIKVSNYSDPLPLLELQYNFS